MCRTEQRPRLEEEFDDARIRWHGAGAHGLQVVELGVIPEDAVGERLDEAAFEIAAARRLAQRQRRDDGEVERRIAARTAEKLVRDEVRFADAERQGQYHFLADSP
jgi:hypothetical protein